LHRKTGAISQSWAASRRTYKNWRTAMKTILSALIALSVIAGVAGSASALNAKTFYEQVDRNHY
jgi:hypothetical protein